MEEEEEEEESSEVLMVGLLSVLGVLLAEVLFFLALSEEEADFDLVRTPFSPFIVCESVVVSVILKERRRIVIKKDRVRSNERYEGTQEGEELMKKKKKGREREKERCESTKGRTKKELIWFICGE